MSTTKTHHQAHKSASAKPSEPQQPPAPAYVPLKWSYPFTTPSDKDGNDAHSYFEALSNAEDGFYPLGANGIWHGGIHFDTNTGHILKQENGVRAIADGEVVAYRLDSQYPVLKYADGKSCMYSTGFVLVRHKLQLPPAPSRDTAKSSQASSATAVSSAPSASASPTVPAAASGASTPTAASAPGDETLTFFSLYMHLLDWQGYKDAIDAFTPGTATPSVIKCMPYWKGEKRYRAGAGATDAQLEPTVFDFSLPESMRLDAPDNESTSFTTPTLEWLDPVQFPAGTSWPEKFRFFDQQSAPGKQKAKQVAAKGALVYLAANGEAIGLLPQGSEVRLGPVSAKDKGWAQITKVLKGDPVGLTIGDPVDTRVSTGWMKIDQLDLLIDPNPRDAIFVLDTPYPVAAGSVLGYLGEYQRYREASKVPPTRQRPLMHMEVFAGPDLPAFIKKSQARAQQLGDQKSFLEIAVGAKLVDVAEPKSSIAKGLVLKPISKEAGEGPWVKVQPTLVEMPAPAPQHAAHGHAPHPKHAKVVPHETSQGSPVWVERAMAGRAAPAEFKAWSDFPLQVANAKAPAAGFDEVYSLGELDKRGADAKVQDDKHAHWWKVTVGTAEGNSREGWVCDTGHDLVRKRSAWEWPGFELIDNTSVPLIDSFKRFLYVQELLFDGDKDSFEPSALSANGSALIQRLEKVVDRLGNKDGKVTGSELARAQSTRWVAQAMSHLVVRYESEWGGDLSKWESLSSLMKERKYIWQGELERIEKLRWWDKVKNGVKDLPRDAAVYHFHPVGVIANFYSPCSSLDALIQKIGDVISLGEGTYESYNTGTRGKHGKVVFAQFRAPHGTVTGKTINEILASVSLPPEDHGRMYTTGKYETIIPTLAAAKNALGLNGDEKYDEQMQERVYRDFLFDQTPGLSNFVKKGYGSVDDAQYAAARQWASIAVPKGLRISKDYGGTVSDGTMSYYEQPGQNGANMKSTNKLRAVLEEVEQMRSNGAL